MKLLFVLILSFIGCSVNSPSLPAFESNTTGTQRGKSIVLTKLLKGKNFEQFIAYSEYHTYGSDKPPYTLYAILIKAGNKWNVEKWLFEHDGTGVENLKPMALEVTLDNMKLNSLFSFLSEMDFFSLNNDSLNIRQLPGSNTFSYFDHGIEVKFDIFSNNNFRRLRVYEPEFYQKEVPIDQRRKFILCKDRFKQFLISSKIF